MPNNKDHQQSGSKSSMGNKSDREFESQGSNPTSGKGTHGKQSGGYGKDTGSSMEDEDMSTSGGREGNFSDKNRGSEGQWSPGSSQSSDQ